MRSTFMLVAATVLAAFAADAAEPAAVPEGQAAAPPATAPAPAPQAAGAEPAAASGNTGATAPAAASADAAGSQPVTLKMATVPPPASFKPPPGYHAVKRGLDTVYCTSATPIGSRMPQTYCMSREQIELLRRQEEIERRLLREKTHTGGTSGG